MTSALATGTVAIILAQSLMFMNIGVTSSTVSDESAEGNYNGQSFFHITDTPYVLSFELQNNHC